MKILFDIPKEYVFNEKWVKVADNRYMRTLSFLEKKFEEKYPLYCSPVLNYFLTEASGVSEQEIINIAKALGDNDVSESM